MIACSTPLSSEATTCVLSMNVDTAARSLAETLKLSRRKMGARRVELKLEAPPPARHTMAERR